MKLYYLLGIALLVLVSSCGISTRREQIVKRNLEIEKQEQELEAQKQRAQRTQDSIVYEKAVRLYDEQEWVKAIEAFNSIKQTEYFRRKGLNYIEKIRDRPWKESYGYLRTTVQGKFSNSATKDSPLWVEIRFSNKGDIYLYMYEYSDSKPSNRSAEKPMYDFSLYVVGYKSEYLCYKIRPSDSFEVNEATHSEGINLSGGLAKKVRNILEKSNENVKFMITMGSSATYEFKLSSDGFSKAYISL